MFDKLNECVQLYRATWEDAKPPELPHWRKVMSQEESKKPLRELEPHRETLSVSLSDAQWEVLRQAAKDNIANAFKSSWDFLNQICKFLNNKS